MDNILTTKFLQQPTNELNYTKSKKGTRWSVGGPKLITPSQKYFKNSINCYRLGCATQINFQISVFTGFVKVAIYTFIQRLFIWESNIFIYKPVGAGSSY